MLRITNFLIDLSLGTHRAQFVQRTARTWPRPCLFRPLLRLFRVCNMTKSQNQPVHNYIFTPRRETEGLTILIREEGKKERLRMRNTQLQCEPLGECDTLQLPSLLFSVARDHLHATLVHTTVYMHNSMQSMHYAPARPWTPKILRLPATTCTQSCTRSRTVYKIVAAQCAHEN